jgi:hypothetical protein
MDKGLRKSGKICSRGTHGQEYADPDKRDWITFHVSLVYSRRKCEVVSGSYGMFFVLKRLGNGNTGL